MNWYCKTNKLANSSLIGYHGTSKANLPSIKKSGLVPGQEKFNFTQSGSWAINVYGINPIYISLDNSILSSNGIYDPEVVLKINLFGLKLYPDLPTFASEYHAYIDEGNGLYWEQEDAVPHLLKEWVDSENYIHFSDCLEQQGLMESMIQQSRTCAVLETITPDKLTIVK